MGRTGGFKPLCIAGSCLPGTWAPLQSVSYSLENWLSRGTVQGVITFYVAMLYEPPLQLPGFWQLSTTHYLASITSRSDHPCGRPQAQLCDTSATSSPGLESGARTECLGEIGTPMSIFLVVQWMLCLPTWDFWEALSSGGLFDLT